jgi:hypothetical protein
MLNVPKCADSTKFFAGSTNLARQNGTLYLAKRTQSLRYDSPAVVKSREAQPKAVEACSLLLVGSPFPRCSAAAAKLSFHPRRAKKTLWASPTQKGGLRGGTMPFVQVKQRPQMQRQRLPDVRCYLMSRAASSNETSRRPRSSHKAPRTHCKLWSMVIRPTAASSG